MPRIVKTFVERAEAGSVPHFTSLAKVGGFDQRPAKPETQKSKRRSLARQLLDEVEIAAANAASLCNTSQDGDPSLQESS
jgi:hypothetical protein